ncbi:hypothetical protein D3C73_1119170 [compost metagenome]
MDRERGLLCLGFLEAGDEDRPYVEILLYRRQPFTDCGDAEAGTLDVEQLGESFQRFAGRGWAVGKTAASPRRPCEAKSTTLELPSARP